MKLVLKINLGIKGCLALVKGNRRGTGRTNAGYLAKEGVRVALMPRSISDLKSLIKKWERGTGLFLDRLRPCRRGCPQKKYDALIKNFGMPSVVVHI